MGICCSKSVCVCYSSLVSFPTRCYCLKFSVYQKRSCNTSVFNSSSYYNLEDVSHDTMNKYLSSLVEKSLFDLECSYCIEIGEVRPICALQGSVRYMLLKVESNRIHAWFEVLEFVFGAICKTLKTEFNQVGSQVMLLNYFCSSLL